jgi:hypothetical protein
MAFFTANILRPFAGIPLLSSIKFLQRRRCPLLLLCTSQRPLFVHYAQPCGMPFPRLLVVGVLDRDASSRRVRILATPHPHPFILHFIFQF